MATSKSNPTKPADIKTRKIIDVTEPGKSAPPSTARPIIVSNRPVLRRDPMMTTPDGMDKEEDTHQTTLPHAAASKTVKIMPLSPLTASDTKAVDEKPATEPVMTTPDPKVTSISVKSVDQREAAKDIGIEAVTNIDRVEDPVLTTPVVANEEKDLQSDDEALPASPAAQTSEPEPSKPSSEDVKPVVEDEQAGKMSETPLPAAQTSVPDEEEKEESSDDQIAPNQAVDQAKHKAQEEKQARLTEEEKLIESKQYYLPINGTERQRRSLDRMILVFVVVLLLALVWLDIVMDAGIFKLGGVQPLTHFFSS